MMRQQNNPFAAMMGQANPFGGGAQENPYGGLGGPYAGIPGGALTPGPGTGPDPQNVQQSQMSGVQSPLSAVGSSPLQQQAPMGYLQYRLAGTGNTPHGEAPAMPQQQIPALAGLGASAGPTPWGGFGGGFGGAVAGQAGPPQAGYWDNTTWQQGPDPRGGHGQVTNDIYGGAPPSGFGGYNLNAPDTHQGGYIPGMPETTARGGTTWVGANYGNGWNSQTGWGQNAYGRR